MKTAVIFGVTGQDGSYLSELLLSKGYRVLGVARRVSTDNTQRIAPLLREPGFELVPGDVTDPMCVHGLLTAYCPEEVYNLAAQSHVGVSFGQPSLTTDVVYKGCLNILETVRLMVPDERPRVYQASSSEMFGSMYSLVREYDQDDVVEHFDYGYKTPEEIWTDGLCEGGADARRKWLEENRAMGWRFPEPYQDESTPMLPNSPYAVAKLAAHHLVRVYRSAYGLHASSGILFNHESERRSETFVTRKITKWMARYAYAAKNGLPCADLRLGNLDAKRDWGHAEDYVRAMWLMLQQDKPDDYVVATGETRTVREFVDAAAGALGLKNHWGLIETDPSLFRPSEVPYLRGDPSKAKRVLGWSPEVTFDGLARRMVLHDREVLDGSRRSGVFELRG